MWLHSVSLIKRQNRSILYWTNSNFSLRHPLNKFSWKEYLWQTNFCLRWREHILKKRFSMWNHRSPIICVCFVLTTCMRNWKTSSPFCKEMIKYCTTCWLVYHLQKSVTWKITLKSWPGLSSTNLIISESTFKIWIKIDSSGTEHPFGSHETYLHSLT